MKENYHPAYRPDIDGLRAVAILSVVIFHVFPGWMPGGFIGVDIFFAISGFLISSIIFRSLEHDSFSFRSFFAHRIRRLFPALILVITSCIIYGWFRLMPAEYKQLGRHAVASMGFFQNLRLRGEAGYFDTSSDLKPLLHLWSLSIEEQFYLIFPMLIWAAWKVGFNALIAVCILAIISFMLNVRGLSTDAVGAFFLPHMRFWELMSGSLLAYLSIIHNSSPGSSTVKQSTLLKSIRLYLEGAVLHKSYANIQALIGFLLIIFSLCFYKRGMPFPGWAALLPIVGSLLIINAGPAAWLNRSLLGKPIMVSIGFISYPLYLWHWPVLAFFKFELGDNIKAKSGIMIIAISLILASLTYWHIERRIKLGYRGAKLTSMLLILGLGTATMGMTITSNKGLSFRFPNLIADLRNDRYVYPREWRGGTCGLDKGQDFSAFARECFARYQTVDGKPSPAKTLLLWGDSFAAHLYPGLKTHIADTFSITQLTTAGCPPVIGYENIERPNCTQVNDSILDYLNTTSHDVVLLAGNWDSANTRELGSTIDSIKHSGHEEIILMGPPPRWENGLPRTLFKSYLKAPSLPLPERISEGFSPITIQLDKWLYGTAIEKGIRYLSAYNVFCNEEGCKTLVGDSIVSFDTGHLSVAGAHFLISTIRDQIISTSTTSKQ